MENWTGCWLQQLFISDCRRQQNANLEMLLSSAFFREEENIELCAREELKISLIDC
jgi:hypothetical protein